MSSLGRILEPVLETRDTTGERLGRASGLEQRRRVLRETSFPGNADARKRVKDAEYASYERLCFLATGTPGNERLMRDFVSWQRRRQETSEPANSS
ncbi:hypothetical protein NDU88_001087 [Pleurodeles waltl]|uniref:Uncharacterized protein n=1 Tax=Pleurodeles waltl TaxID=8319 RepID=A0AAV7U5W3_PLEWA|nr:hypothetical protein NDU88_001086 [Pleurodeles waltl]KAJ1184279.1 hypothetical protein NDU88_001087 [Pleurodeles waltl]